MNSLAAIQSVEVGPSLIQNEFATSFEFQLPYLSRVDAKAIQRLPESQK